jgi:hypothetical protein
VGLGSCSALHSRWPPSYEQATALANLLERCHQKKLTQVSRYASLYRILGLDRKANFFEKAEMAANIFYILSVLLARLSLLSLITKLTPNRRHQFVSFALSGLIIVWSIISVFVAAFECRLPNSWDYTREKCINRVGWKNASMCSICSPSIKIAWWIVSDIVNILAETVLIMMPVYIICIVQWSVSKKILFSIPFIVRIWYASQP